MLTSHRSIACASFATIAAIGCIFYPKVSFSIPSTDSSPGEPAKSDRTDTFTSSQRSELSGIVRFEPPPESPPAPPDSGGGGSRGIVHFEPPPEEPAAPGESGGGGSRYRWEFEPPDEDAPEESGSGASRSENEFAVSSQDSESQLVSLTPLVPETHYGRTVSAHPSFFVYVPETVARQMFFSLHEYVATDNETVDRFPHYQGVLSISGCEGIVQLTLPSEARELELGKNYQWYVAVVTSDRLRPDSPSTSGWVRRVPQSPDWESLASKENSLDLAATYGRSGIWYDALEVLAALRQARPHSNVLATEWRDLLAQVGLEAIADRPFVDSTSVSSTHECGNG